MFKIEINPNTPLRLMRVSTIAHTFDLLLKGQLRFMQESGFEVTMACRYEERALLVAKREGVRYQNLSIERRISPLRDLLAVIKLTQTLISQRADIVHSHSPKAGVVAMLAAWTARVPIRIHTVAGAPWESLTGVPRILMILADWLACKCAHKVLFNSVEQLTTYVAKGITSPHKAALIGKGSSNGIDLGRFRPPEDKAIARQRLVKDFALKDDSVLLLFIGRQSRSKGLEELYQAFTQLLSKSPHLILIVAGEEEKRDPIGRRLLEEMRSNSSVRLTGFYESVELLMQGADIFVFPSHREGLPQALLQAAACELPIVTSDISGSREILQDRASAIFFPATDVEKLAGAIETLISDPDLSKKIAFTARKQVEQTFEQQQYWRELLDFYHSQIKIRLRS